MGTLSVSIVRSSEPDDTLMDEWVSLFHLQPAPANPFLHPVWVLGWLRTYDLEPALVLVRRTDTGALVGVAPMFVQKLSIGPVTAARRMIPVGCGFSSPLEMPGRLAAPGWGREVSRMVVGATIGDPSADWCEISLGEDQGWFEPEWAFGEAPVSFGEHVRSRACVMLTVESTWAATRSALKRNVKESIRRSTNRLAKHPGCTEVRELTGADLDRAALDRFLDLHRSRSANDSSGIDHHDAYADVRHRELLRTVLPVLAREGLASVFELVIDGEVVAAQLALRAPGTAYVHSSGFLPSVWNLGPTTLLQSEVVRTAVERGDGMVNFSPGPSVSKLRWSETLWVGNDFAYGAGGRSLAARYGVFGALSTVKAARHAMQFTRRQRKSTQPPAAPSAGRSVEVGSPSVPAADGPSPRQVAGLVRTG